MHDGVPPPPLAAAAACCLPALPPASLLLILLTCHLLQGVESLDGLRLRLVDAKGQVVGRLASQIATILQVPERN